MSDGQNDGRRTLSSEGRRRLEEVQQHLPKTGNSHAQEIARFSKQQADLMVELRRVNEELGKCRGNLAIYRGLFGEGYT